MAFPALERLKLKPHSKANIKAILNYDLIVFDDFEHARPFFSCIKTYFSVDYLSRGGLLIIPYNGR